MTENLRSMPSKTKTQTLKELGEDYFHEKHESIKERMDIVREKSHSVEAPDIYGSFKDKEHYLSTLKLLASSTTEARHKEELISREVIAKLQSLDSFLDIGVGIGDFTQKIATHFHKITAIDTSIEALNNIPDQINGNNVHKIEGSILDRTLEIYQSSYDMILLSHVLYYIDKSERIPLIKSLYQLLNNNGFLVIVFNDEGDRANLGKHFSSTDPGFGDLQSQLPTLYKDFELHRIEEFFDGGDLESMMKIAGISLNDYGINASEEELAIFLSNNYCHNNICQMNTIQNIMILGEINDY